MPTLVNNSGENELYGKLFHTKPVDSNTLLSVHSCVDVYCSPRKRMHCNFPVKVWGDEKQASMESLPEECLFEIFRRLPSQERSACACVSKGWLSILSSIRNSDICNPDLNDAGVSFDEEVEDGSLSRCLEGKKATDTRLLAISVGTSIHGGLVELSIGGSSSSHGVTDFGLSGIARSCPALKSFSLWKVPCVSDKGLSEIARGCSLLEKLDLCHCTYITNDGLIAIAENCPNLSVLRIESCSNIGNEGLQAIAQCCSKLKMISIKDCPLIGDQGIASLSSSSSLIKMKLDGLSISDFSLASLAHNGKSIVHLNLSNLKNVSEKGFWILGSAGGLRSLMSLAVTSCLGVTDLSIEAIGKGCTSLKQIFLRKCHFVLDQGLVAFSKSAVSLESLHLEEINRITLPGVISALSGCPSKLRNLSLVSCGGIKDTASRGGELLRSTPCRSIRSLSVRNCPGFGSAGLIILGKMCPEVCHLDLSGLYGVTDEGLLSFLQFCEGALLELNLNGCFNLSDKVITSIVSSHGPTIKTMNLEGCRKLTDVSLIAIAENCQVLVDLYMAFCAVTDSGLAALSSADQLNLEILSFSGCRRLSDKSVFSLIKMQESLVGLNIQHCSSMSSSAINLLEEILWRCDILS